MAEKRQHSKSGKGSTSKRVHKEDDWSFFGPYLPERQWGTVREDYSADGNCWNHFPHDASVYRAYRWGEDGMLGVCDKEANLCCSLALWNGQDAILKERLFGLTNSEGNHGEDVKELYYYIDNTPDHTYMRALYKYPQAAFPYCALIEGNKRSPEEPEFEILNTGVFEEEEYWDVFVEYAKDSPESLYCCCTIINRSENTADICVIPQTWFRNTWSWSQPGSSQDLGGKPSMSACNPQVIKVEYELGKFCLYPYNSSEEVKPELLFTENETRPVCEDGCGDGQFFKDAFHRYIIQGVQDAVNPEGQGTKCGMAYKIQVPSHGQHQIWWALCPQGGNGTLAPPPVRYISQAIARRRTQAERFYSAILPRTWDPVSRQVGQQAAAGLLWSKMFYCYSPKEKDAELKSQDSDLPESRFLPTWHHLYNKDIIIMPDKWEFPWYAPWDLAFHIVAMARLDVNFAKQQVLLFLSSRYMSADGELPSCEFNFHDANPPLHAWACLHVFRVDECRDHAFLSQCFQKLFVNFGWWLKKESGDEGCFLYSAGFLGLDNISPINRSEELPEGHLLQQADATGWVAFYCLNMLEISVELARFDSSFYGKAQRFLTHFMHITAAINQDVQDGGLWSPEEKLFCDVYTCDEERVAMAVESWVAIIPLFASCALTLPHAPQAIPMHTALVKLTASMPRHVIRVSDRGFFLSMTPVNEVAGILQKVFDESRLLSPYGIRSLSKKYETEPFAVDLAGEQRTLSYAPGESDNYMFGGNSNWRGPIWLPMNYMMVECLDIYDQLPDSHRPMMAFPTGSSTLTTLGDIARKLSKRVVSLFIPDKNGHRPVHGGENKYASDGPWWNLLLFNEYFHADTGRGCGASHQTGWSALVLEFLHRAKTVSKTKRLVLSGVHTNSLPQPLNHQP